MEASNNLIARHLQITIGDLNVENAKKLVSDHTDVNIIHLDVFDSNSRTEAVKNADIVISMLPARFHIEVAKDCITYKKHMVTIIMYTPNRSIKDQFIINIVILILISIF